MKCEVIDRSHIPTLGKEAAEEYCKRNKHIGAVILPDDPNSEVFIVGKIDVEL